MQINSASQEGMPLTHNNQGIQEITSGDRALGNRTGIEQNFQYRLMRLQYTILHDLQRWLLTRL
ncbi:hypothetical protein D8B25_18410 [Verminephrobacter aporrectodeae subsp. tuberculatae]|nr:hypothetical protein [Verminephrobacter aporrectodeae subsp. tuberculatae]MCW8204696.1 hypothetical protein [Verminephrobacter aporrectodeae subsp. tuberculatae]